MTVKESYTQMKIKRKDEGGMLKICHKVESRKKCKKGEKYRNGNEIRQKEKMH